MSIHYSAEGSIADVLQGVADTTGAPAKTVSYSIHSEFVLVSNLSNFLLGFTEYWRTLMIIFVITNDNFNSLQLRLVEVVSHRLHKTFYPDEKASLLSSGDVLYVWVALDYSWSHDKREKNIYHILLSASNCTLPLTVTRRWLNFRQFRGSSTLPI